MTERPWISQKERGATPGMRIMLFVLNTFGYAVARLFIYPVVGYFYLTGKAARHAAITYLKRVHRHCGKGRPPGFFQGFAHFISFAESTLDKLWFWQSRLDRFNIRTDNLDVIKPYLRAGQGCLILGAHMGNIDALRVLCREQQVTVNAVMYLDNAQRFNALLQRINPDSQLNIINLRDRTIEGVLALRTCIENGEIVAILADRFHPSSRTRVVIHPFLGEDAPFPANPWVVASLLECPTFFVAGIRTGRRAYDSVVQFVTEKVTLDRNRRDTDIQKYVAKYAVFLEQLCCEYPYQWFNFYDFWSTDDHAEAPDH
jgi:predicted LPLAT superfamily acyltransferase